MAARHEDRTRRARRSAWRLLAVGLAEGAAGAAAAVWWPEQRDAGLALSACGLGHALTGVATVNLADRRAQSFAERMAWADAHPDAWPGLQQAALFSVDRDGRANAYGAGLWSGVGLAGGGAALFATDAHDQGVGGALAIGGLVGTLHHATRWGASTRLGWQLRSSDHGP